jgi:hypothetical protein
MAQKVPYFVILMDVQVGTSIGSDLSFFSFPRWMELKLPSLFVLLKPRLLSVRPA